MIDIAVFVSGGGTNLQALIDAEKNGVLKSGKIRLVVSSNVEAYALERADDAGIKTAVVPRKDYRDSEQYGNALLKVLKQNNIDIVVLAGFMSIFTGEILKVYSDKIINVHPSLIPSFCGKGYYGLKVHEAALKYGVKVSGATVHLVNEVVDGGRILKQKAVDILDGDTPETLQKRIMETCEWIILPQAVEELSFELEKEKNT